MNVIILYILKALCSVGFWLSYVIFICSIFDFFIRALNLDSIIFPSILLIGSILLFLICSYSNDLLKTEIKQIETTNYQDNVVKNYFIKDGYYYFELENTNNYVKIPANEV